MKKIIKHRIDVLMDLATAGDRDAQFRLAKEFIRGRFVKKSKENAMCWAFKAVDNGNFSAIQFYNSIAEDK